MAESNKKKTSGALIIGNVPEQFPENLENKLGIETFILERDAVFGQYVVKELEDALDKYGCVIYGLLTKDDEKTEHKDVVKVLALASNSNIIPVKFVKDAVVPPSLSHLSSFTYDGESKEFWEELKQRIIQPESLKSVLPVGNISHGLVHNYLRGYLMRIMRTTANSKSYLDLYETGLASIREAYGEVQSLKKLILLLPKGCTCKDSLGDYDKSIEYLTGDAIQARHDRLGHDKIMLNAVYKIEHGGKTYALLLEVPNILTTIGKLLNREGVTFSQEHLQVQYGIFRDYLKEALDFQQDLKDDYHVIEFDESDENLNLGELIVTEVEKIKAKSEVETREDKPASSDSKPKVAKYDVNIVCGNEELDEELRSIVEKLEDDGFKVFTPEARTPGTSVIDAMGREIDESTKTLFWVTKELDRIQEHTYYQAHEVQEKAQRARLLPVVKGDTFPKLEGFQYLQTINHLYSTEPDFYKKLVNAITGEAPLTYPLGDIASGLVWTYCLNYLEPIAEGYVQEYEKKLKDDKESKQFPKFICLLPKSCDAPGQVKEYDPTIEYSCPTYNEEVLVKMMISGKERHFNKPIFKVTHGGKVYKVLVEFSAPLKALAETEIGMKTQLSNKHKHEQRQKFNQLLREVVSDGKRKGTPLRHVELLEFDDQFEDQPNRKRPKFNLSKLIAERVDGHQS